MTDYNSDKLFDPKLKEAMAEVVGVLKKYDIAGMIVLNSLTHAEFLNEVAPSWSVLKFQENHEGEQFVRFKAVKSDFKTEDEWAYHLDRTVNFVVRMHDLCGYHYKFFGRLLKMIEQNIEIVRDHSKITSRNESLN